MNQPWPMVRRTVKKNLQEVNGAGRKINRCPNHGSLRRAQDTDFPMLRRPRTAHHTRNSMRTCHVDTTRQGATDLVPVQNMGIRK